MKKEHAYGHTITDLIIEFENATKEELWDLYKLTKKKLDQEIKDHKDTKLAYDVLKDELKAERLAHEETKKRLEESEAKIKYLLERETLLESQLSELNIERLKPFVLRSEMENMKSIMQIMIDERQERLQKLEDANQKLRELYYVERRNLAQFREYSDTYYPDLWDCFESSRARKGEAMG